MKQILNIYRKEEREVRLAEHYAHRGLHDKPRIPENSLAAFRRSAEKGYPAEFDVHLIADGSLVVFHDEELWRETGVRGRIEDYDLSNLSRLRLEGTDERIPSFDEVLGIFEDTGLPLLIELKCAGGNHRELARAVCARLGRYRGEFVIESFDPRALIEVRRVRPDIIRGQLVQDFIRRREGLPLYQAVMLTGMAMNPLAQPDFIAFRYEDRRLLGHSLRGRAAAVWTITDPEDYEAAVCDGFVPIFEQFEPQNR